ncbi:O-antigen/teichoic acid export membrane protein [Paenibacillus sp. BK033]|uniref:lipopolysaccharide biosynthesis protein n=1 Tax=Paenibacillus sp. BK033 TaxID=2512133 RepID=UPI001046F87E|nr:lipopolysaccharide biosynthesis protein [Paenibacillus sp. BK033]TCM92806.1 O-antigen/teichoic acid export membrane protein [Paenibacillus sp. BK033]
MQRNRLIKKTGLYLIGNLSSRIMSAIIIPIYAFFIQANDLGYFDYAQTIMGIVIPIIFVAIWEAILRFLLYENDDLYKAKILATSVGFIIFIMGIFVIGLIIYGSFFATETKSICFIGLMFISNGISQIWLYYARAFGDNKLYITAGLAGAVIQFVSVLMFICILRFGLNGLFITSILGQFSIFVTIEKRLHILSKFKFKYFEFRMLKSLLKFSSPLVLNLSFAWILSGFGRFLIVNYFGNEMNGLFSFANKFSILITMMGSIVTMAVIEEAIITAKTKGFDSEFTKTIEFIFKIFMELTLLAVPAINIFYAFIKSTDYYVSYNYASWLLLVAVFTTMSSNIGSVFQAIDKTQYQFITTMIGAIVSVLTSYVLISVMGIYAVILGQILGALLMLLSRYVIINKYIDFKIKWKPILIKSGLFIGIVITSINSLLLVNIIILLVITVVLSYLNSNYLLNGYNLVMKKLRSV